MEVVWILFAFACGLGAKLIALPPLVGFLAAGFLLNAIGIEPEPRLDQLADLGIILMLFTIGLKLDIKDLIKREVWVGALAHLGVWTLVIGSLALTLAAVSMPFFFGMDWGSAAIIAFALGFSSTVCIIKILEESGEMNSRHGKFSVGVLVMQDMVAVVFLVFATGEVPSLWALLLIGLYFARPLLGRLLQAVGHGEMLPLAGFLLALGGYQLFDLVGVKGDLGALIVGMLLSSHDKASELARSLLGFKDLFLIGFFLSIGLTALPDLSMLLTALVLCLLLPFKAVLFFALFTRLRMRARHSFLASLALGNYSEFGLIVAHLSVESGWLSKEWLVVLALAVSFSFVVTSLLYKRAHASYAVLKSSLRRYENPERLLEDAVERPSRPEILVIGVGRVGKGALKALHAMVGDRVWGMDSDRARIARQREEGLHVFSGDGDNAEIWENIDISRLKLVLLAIPAIEDCRNVVEQLRIAGYEGLIAAVARYDDEREALATAGIHRVFNFYQEAGIGFAEDSLRLIEGTEAAAADSRA